MARDVGPKGGGMTGGQQGQERGYYSPAYGQAPVWGGGRAGNPTQYRRDLQAYQRMMQPQAAAAPAAAPVGLKFKPTVFGPTALRVPGRFDYSMMLSPWTSFRR